MNCSKINLKLKRKERKRNKKTKKKDSIKKSKTLNDSRDKINNSIEENESKEEKGFLDKLFGSDDKKSEEKKKDSKMDAVKKIAEFGSKNSGTILKFAKSIFK